MSMPMSSRRATPHHATVEPLGSQHEEEEEDNWERARTLAHWQRELVKAAFEGNNNNVVEAIAHDVDVNKAAPIERGSEKTFTALYGACLGHHLNISYGDGDGKEYLSVIQTLLDAGAEASEGEASEAEAPEAEREAPEAGPQAPRDPRLLAPPARCSTRECSQWTAKYLKRLRELVLVYKRKKPPKSARKTR